MKENIPFCYDALQDQKYICIPIPRTVWADYTLEKRDYYVEEIFVSNIEQRIVLEFSPGFSGGNIIFSNKDCVTKYKEFLCKWNFPSCETDDNYGVTNPVDCSVCQNYFNACDQDTTPCALVYSSLKPGLTDGCS